MPTLAKEVLTLAINALRDIAESKRMPSGLPITEDVAALHEDAAEQIETLRKFLERGERLGITT